MDNFMRLFSLMLESTKRNTFKNDESNIIKSYVNITNEEYIISIGSGTGKLENTLDKNIICVDPSPNSYDKGEIIINPEYDNVDRLIENKPDVVSNCTVLLIWPYPQDKMDINCDPYDYDAILKLKPNNVILKYEVIGAAGSDNLLKWLNGINIDNYNNINEIIENDGYMPICYYDYKYGDNMHELNSDDIKISTYASFMCKFIRYILISKNNYDISDLEYSMDLNNINNI